VILPPVIYDDKREEVRAALNAAIRAGASHVLCTNLGQAALIEEAVKSAPRFVTVTGDFRLSAMNRFSVAVLEDVGLDRVILSPELSLPQMRDLYEIGEAIVYGRLPLMLLEKCVNIGKGGKKTGAPCQSCMKHHEGCTDACAHQPSAMLTDRKRVSFPVLREWEHRNVIYNSVPTYMADRMDQLIRARITAHHYIFSTESPKEVDHVIVAYKKGLAPEGAVRRIAQ
jgi:collagenase-like PrtC family protease